MYKFNNSTLSFEEWIRLNDINTPQILEAANIIAEQETIIEQQEQEIDILESFINSFDFETMDYLLDELVNESGNQTEHLMGMMRILDNYKSRIEE